jgi:hypothetical protein
MSEQSFIVLTNADIHLLLLALARLECGQPRWQPAMRSLAAKLGGLALFEQFHSEVWQRVFTLMAEDERERRLAAAPPPGAGEGGG